MSRFWFCVLLLCFSANARSAERGFSFAEDLLDKPPAGFEALLGGGGAPGEWKVIEDETDASLPNLSGLANRKSTRRLLAQVSRDATDERFPMLLHSGEIYGDFVATVRVKMVDGTVEQMAGLAFRVTDERNYYYVRANALTGTLYFVKVVDGIRSAPIGVRLSIAKGQWHTLSVDCRGNQIKVFWNEHEAIPAMTDKSFTHGKLGFWTKSDSVSYFSDLRISYTPREILAQTLVRDALTKYEKVEDLMVFTHTPKDTAVRAVATAKPEDLGRTAGKVEQDVMKTSRVYHSKVSRTVTMTLPMHDSNGETVAAVRVVMKSFPGETEKTAITRAVPIIKGMESRIRNHHDLVN